MKKIISIILTVLMFITFTSCGSKQTSSQNSKEVIELRFTWWGGDLRHKATLDAIKRFEELNPNIKIKAEYAGWQGFQEKITTQIAGGTEADIMQINWNWLTIFSPKGDGFYDLYQLKNELGLNNYSEDILKYAEINGKLNGIPVSMSGRVLYYNKTTYDKFKAEFPKTWDDFLNVAKKFNQKGYYPLDLDPYSAIILTTIYEEQKTGKQFISNDGKLQFTVEEIKDALKLYKDFVDNKVVPSIKERSGEGGGNETPLYQMPNWIEGKYAGVFEWTSSVSKYQDPIKEKGQELALGELPVIEGAKSNGWYVKPSMLFAISKKTKYPKEAAKFLNFLLNDPEGVKLMGTQRGIPASNIALETLKSEGKLQGLEFDGTQLVLSKQGIGLSPYFENSRLQSIYMETIEKFGQGQLDLDGAAKFLYENVEKTLKEIVK